MYKYVLFLLLTLTTSVVYSQTNFVRGFSDGYKNGYCYGNNVGCIPPLPPVTPLPKIGESGDSYLDGYNRGFLWGQNKVSQQSISYNPNNNLPIHDQSLKIPDIPLFKPDFAFYQQILAQVRQNVINQQATIPAISEKDRAIFDELENPVRIKQETEYVAFLRNYYSDLRILPSHIPDGKYKAMRIDDPHNVKEVEVIVKNNCVINLRETNPFSNDYMHTLDVNEFPEYKNEIINDIIREQTAIVNGRAKYRFETYEKATNTYHKNNILYELYFLDYISIYQQAQKKITELKKEYGLKTTFQKISDGWHICYAIDGEVFCDLRKVYVESGKVTKYKTGQNEDFSVSSGGSIVNGKSNISYYYKDKQGNNSVLMILEIYFL